MSHKKLKYYNQKSVIRWFPSFGGVAKIQRIFDGVVLAVIETVTPEQAKEKHWRKEYECIAQKASKK